MLRLASAPASAKLSPSATAGTALLPNEFEAEAEALDADELELDAAGTGAGDFAGGDFAMPGRRTPDASAQGR